MQQQPGLGDVRHVLQRVRVQRQRRVHRRQVRGGVLLEYAEFQPVPAELHV
jgi:hypothetical protein